MRLHDTPPPCATDEHEHVDPAGAPSLDGQSPGECARADGVDVVQYQERKDAVQEYVVKVQCSRLTLFAFMLSGSNRFISFDERPRMVTHADALEIQGRLPVGLGQPPVSIEKVDSRPM